MSAEPPDSVDTTRPPDGVDAEHETVHDVALQQERTALAWDRTAVAWLVAGGLFLRTGTPPYHHPRHLAGVAALVLGAVLLAHAYRRYARQRAALAAGRGLASPGLVRLVGIGATAFGVAALARVVLGA